MRVRCSALAAWLIASALFPARGASGEGHDAGWKSEGNALAYSFFGTALPLAAGAYVGSRDGESDLARVLLPIGVGYVFGPSLGHFYAGNSRRALVGLGVRAATIGAVWGLSETSGDGEEEFGNVVGVGLIAGIVGSIWALSDIVDAPKSARTQNRKRGLSGIRVEPAMIGRAAAPGVRVGCNF